MVVQLTCNALTNALTRKWITCYIISQLIVSLVKTQQKAAKFCHSNVSVMRLKVCRW